MLQILEFPGNLLSGIPKFYPKKTHQERVQLGSVVGKEPGRLLAQLADLGNLGKKRTKFPIFDILTLFYALNPAPCTPRGCRDWLQSWIKWRLEGDEKGFPHIPATFQLVWNGFLHPLEFTATDPS